MTIKSINELQFIVADQSIEIKPSWIQEIKNRPCINTQKTQSLSCKSCVEYRQLDACKDYNGPMAGDTTGSMGYRV